MDLQDSLVVLPQVGAELEEGFLRGEAEFELAVVGVEELRLELVDVEGDAVSRRFAAAIAALFEPAVQTDHVGAYALGSLSEPDPLRGAAWSVRFCSSMKAAK